MVKTFDNLGARHRALNTRVNETAASQVPFEVIKTETEYTEVDKLYKIDLAIKHKNSDYILEILKSSDSLHISRVLKKCSWLFEDDASHIVNPDNLHNNVFPLISIKMKRKILKAAAAKVTNAERAAEFFHYLMKEKMNKSAWTSLLYTKADFKIEQLLNNEELSHTKCGKNDMTYFRLLVQKSLDTLEALLGFLSSKVDRRKLTHTVMKFKNLFCEGEDKYLDLAEKFIQLDYCTPFDINLSDHIIKKHKVRVFNKPKFYIKIVDIDILLKNCTVDDIKIICVKALLPAQVDKFWRYCQNATHVEKRVFKSIPHEETYMFFKDYFTKNFPSKEFEMDPNFYKLEFYQYMTNEQQEEWAFRHINSDKQILGVGRNYLFYKFVNFSTAFEEIKRFVSITSDANKRNEMVEVLIYSAKNDFELEMLFKYYSKRHTNEKKEYRLSFLDKVLSHHNVFEFQENTWQEFYMLLPGIGQVNKANSENYDNNKIDNYKTATVLYHILHEKEIPEKLVLYLRDYFRFDFVTDHLTKIQDHKKRKMLHDFFFNFYMNVIDEAKNESYERNHFSSVVEPNWERYFENIDKSMNLFNEHEKEDKPKNVAQTKAKRKQRRKPKVDGFYEFDEISLLRDLKKDKELVINKLSSTISNFSYESYPIHINNFLKKITVYFSNDVSNVYLNRIQETYLKKTKGVHDQEEKDDEEVVNSVKIGVNVILQLADEDVKLDFLKKYFPINKKNLKNTDIEHLLIQRAICQFLCNSRPLVPLSTILAYMKGDCVKYCLHLLNMYIATLPLPMCIKIVSSLIDAPVSIQKHAVKLVFHCFESKSLKEVILNLWKSTKNVSLRSIIYQDFYNKVVDSKEGDMYEVLKTLTLDLNQDDEDDIFRTTASEHSNLPEDFIGDHVVTVWGTVEKFKNIEPNITRKENIIGYMTDYIHLVNEDFVSKVVEKYLETMINENNLPLFFSNEDIRHLYWQQLRLTAHYVICFACQEDQSEKYVQLSQFIIEATIQKWNEMHYDRYVYQRFCWDFFYNLRSISFDEIYGCVENIIPIFKGVLKTVETNLKYYDNYLLTWELQLALLTATTMKTNRNFCENSNGKTEVISKIATAFGDGVGKLVLNCVDDNTFFMSFSDVVQEKVRYYVECLLKCIYEEMYDDTKGSDEFNDRALINVAVALAKFELAEAYVLAIKLVPSKYEDCCSDVYKSLINKLQRFSDAEVQLTLYQKLQEHCNRDIVLRSPAPLCEIQ